MDIRKFSSNTFPFNMFLAEASRTCLPRIRYATTQTVATITSGTAVNLYSIRSAETKRTAPIMRNTISFLPTSPWS